MIKELVDIWDNNISHKKIMVLTGPQISLNAGIPLPHSNNNINVMDFWDEAFMKTSLNLETLQLHPELIWKWALDKREHINLIEPTSAHHSLVKLENFFKSDFSLVTENIDGLHKTAGLIRHIELNGNILENEILNKKDIVFHESKLNIPKNKNNELLRPALWLDGEKIKKKNFIKAHVLAQQANIVLIIGANESNEKIAELAFTAKKFNDAKIIELNEEKGCFFTDLHISSNIEDLTALLIGIIIDLEKGFRQTNNNLRNND